MREWLGVAEKIRCELTRQRGWERPCSRQREQSMQKIGDKMAFWRTEGRARCYGWFKRGRGLVEASKAGATSGRALDLMFQMGPWRVVSQGQ